MILLTLFAGITLNPAKPGVAWSYTHMSHIYVYSSTAAIKGLPDVHNEKLIFLASLLRAAPKAP